jgi:hypothetical protein
MPLHASSCRAPNATMNLAAFGRKHLQAGARSSHYFRAEARRRLLPERAMRPERHRAIESKVNCTLARRAGGDHLIGPHTYRSMMLHSITPIRYERPRRAATVARGASRNAGSLERSTAKGGEPSNKDFSFPSPSASGSREGWEDLLRSRRAGAEAGVAAGPHHGEQGLLRTAPEWTMSTVP